MTMALLNTPHKARLDSPSEDQKLAKLLASRQAHRAYLCKAAKVVRLREMVLSETKGPGASKKLHGKSLLSRYLP